MTPLILELLLLAILTFLLLTFGWKRGFFSLPPSENWFFPIRAYHVILFFGIYFFVAALVSPFLILCLKKFGVQFPSIAAAVWINFLSSLTILLLFGISIAFLSKNITQPIWRQKKEGNLFSDLKFGALAWLISFPLVIFCNQFFEVILHELLHFPIIPEQLAVRFLKMTFEEPLYFFLTSLTIAIFAPLIEETLFRGFLQSFIRQHLSVNQSILITAFCFSLFHYSPEQGIGNLSIITSLFILALFLWYLYDRRQSLAAPIALHAIFNTINIANLYFFGEFPMLGSNHFFSQICKICLSSILYIFRARVLQGFDL